MCRPRRLSRAWREARGRSATPPGSRCHHPGNRRRHLRATRGRRSPPPRRPSPCARGNEGWWNVTTLRMSRNTIIRCGQQWKIVDRSRTGVSGQVLRGLLIRFRRRPGDERQGASPAAAGVRVDTGAPPLLATPPGALPSPDHRRGRSCVVHVGVGGGQSGHLHRRDVSVWGRGAGAWYAGRLELLLHRALSHAGRVVSPEHHCQAQPGFLDPRRRRSPLPERDRQPRSTDPASDILRPGLVPPARRRSP